MIIFMLYDPCRNTGKLFIDRLTPLRRTLLKSKLADITKGNVDVEYKMKFPLKK